MWHKGYNIHIHFYIQCFYVISTSEMLSMWWFSVLTAGINVKAMMEQMARRRLK